MADDAGDVEAFWLARLMESLRKAGTNADIAELTEREACLVRCNTMPFGSKLLWYACSCHDLETT